MVCNGVRLAVQVVRGVPQGMPWCVGDMIERCHSMPRCPGLSATTWVGLRDNASYRSPSLAICGLSTINSSSITPNLSNGSDRLSPGSASPLGATDQHLVDRDMNQLDEVTNGSHNKESHANGLADLDEFTLVGLSAAANKLRTLTNEVLGDIGKLLESLRHDGRNEEL